MDNNYSVKTSPRRKEQHTYIWGADVGGGEKEYIFYANFLILILLEVLFRLVDP